MSEEPSAQTPDQPPTKETSEEPTAQAKEPQATVTLDEPSATKTPEEPKEQPAPAKEEPQATVKSDEPATKAPEEPKEQPVPAKEEPQAIVALDESATKPLEETTEQVREEPKATAKPAHRPERKKSSDESSVASAGAARLQHRKVPVNSFKDVRPVLKKTLDQLKNPLVKKMEKQTGMDREKLFYSLVAFLSFYLMFGPGNVLLSTLIGSLYPSYMTMLTVLAKTNRDDTQWLVYWCAFALFSLVDHFVAPFELLFALYLVLKTAALLYLAIPQTYGAHNVFVKYVHPMVDRLGKRKAK